MRIKTDFPGHYYVVDLICGYGSGKNVVRFYGSFAITMNTWYHFRFICEYTGNGLLYISMLTIYQSLSH